MLLITDQKASHDLNLTLTNKSHISELLLPPSCHRCEAARPDGSPKWAKKLVLHSSKRANQGAPPGWSPSSLSQFIRSVIRNAGRVGPTIPEFLRKGVTG